MEDQELIKLKNLRAKLFEKAKNLNAKLKQQEVKDDQNIMSYKQ